MSLGHVEMWAHRDAMVGVCEGVLGRGGDAADCAAEAMTQVLERQPQGAEIPRALVLTVAKRRAIDHLRGRARARKRDAVLAATTPLTTPDIAEDVVAQAYGRWADQQARTLLKPTPYAVLRKVADGASLREVGRELGMTERAAENHLRRARVTLRAALANALGVLGVVFGLARRTPSSAAAAGVPVLAAVLAFAVVATANLPLLPAPTPPRATGQAFSSLTTVSPSARRPERVQEVRSETPRAAAASSAEGSGSAGNTTNAHVKTPVAGARLYDKDDGHDSDGPVEQVLTCVQNLYVDLQHAGC